MIQPVAWMTWQTLDGKRRLKVGESTTNKRYTEVHKEWLWEPLYDQQTMDALRIDAERYRWLNDNAEEEVQFCDDRETAFLCVLVPVLFKDTDFELDDAIDAARARTSK